ncbi:MAG: hypothetical protein IKS28_05420 [Clostridia bacterium]|nr:hypothetical protein [Clostridia bacterium]
MKSFVHRVLYPACLLFTVLCVVFSALLSWADSEMLLPTISIGNLCQIFCFSLVVAGANLLFSIGKLPYPACFVLHFLCSLAAFWLIFLVIGRHFSEGNAGTMLLVFAGIYLIFALPVIVVHCVRGRNKKRESEKTYKRQFR